MANCRILIAVCLFASISQVCQSILVGNTTENQKNNDEKEQNRAAGNGKELDTNSSFYYEADSYLLNNKEPNAKFKSQNATQESLSAGESSSKVELNFKPASIAMTSARTGRMLDLDALVGDFAASKANAERHQTGNRQSRFLSSGSLDSIDAKKQLQIQGFIPIIGLKDLTEDESNSQQRPNELPAISPNSRYQQQMTQQQQQISHELPYGQSSIGHATFPTQRYLNTDPYPTNNDLSSQASHLQAAAAAAAADAYKRPTRKISGFSNIQTDTYQLQVGVNSQAGRQNCLCVPFYSCKNGYISESSLGKTQIQQMIAQQQQQQQQQQHLVSSSEQNAEIRHNPTLRSGTVESVPIQATPLIDERSLDRELVTAPSTTSFDNSQAAVNQTIDFSAEATLNGGDLNQAALAAPAEDPSKSNATLASNFSNDYSQEILGRMLGLGSNSKLSQQQSAAFGSCGLLRTCCNIPIHLFPSQQDLANEKLMSQYGGSAPLSNSNNKYLGHRVNGINMQQSNDLISLPSQQQLGHVQHQLQNPMQQLAQPVSHQSNKLHYGLPSSRSQALQQLNTFNHPPDGLLAHRSTLYSGQAPAMVRAHNSLQQAQSQPAQYTRAVSPAQPLQSFNQPIQRQGNQQQLAKALTPMISLASSSGRQSPLTPVHYLSQLSSHQSQQVSPSSNNMQTTGSHSQPQQQSSQLIGTRKILEGRCGLRNSAGITGRVQNLQYHDSSADFGEYPAQAAILKRLSGSDNLFVCGGTLISQYWVATAAHCIKKNSQSDLKVRLGEWDVHRDDEFYPYVEKEIRDLIIHPEFVAGNLINDIALLRLDSPVDPSLPHVIPACLPTIDETFDRQHCSVTGWGKDSFGQKGSFQAVLREVELPVVGHQECESSLRSTRLGPHYRLHSGFICAGGEGGKDACEGDGGSGLYCSQNGVIKVIGLVSWGIGCGQAGVPGVYVNMAHYRPWIENIISIDEDIYSPYNNLLGNTLISERSNGNSSSINQNTSAQSNNNNSASGPSSTTTERPSDLGDN